MIGLAADYGEPDYSEPFVDGTPTVRASCSTAILNARAEHLKMPSAM